MNKHTPGHITINNFIIATALRNIIQEMGFNFLRFYRQRRLTHSTPSNVGGYTIKFHGVSIGPNGREARLKQNPHYELYSMLMNKLNGYLSSMPYEAHLVSNDRYKFNGGALEIVVWQRPNIPANCVPLSKETNHLLLTAKKTTKPPVVKEVAKERKPPTRSQLLKLKPGTWLEVRRTPGSSTSKPMLLVGVPHPSFGTVLQLQLFDPELKQTTSRTDHFIVAILGKLEVPSLK